MNARKIREHLGQARTSCQRRDFTRALNLTIMALKELGKQSAPIDTRSDFRDTLTELSADPTFKANVKTPISYQPGKELEIREILVNLYNTLQGVASNEDYDTALQRKLGIDHALRDGKAFLSRGKLPEAEASFAEALKNYRDEDSLFAVIARAYMEKEEYVRALGYLREGLKKAPSNSDLLRLSEECARLRQQAGK